MELGGGGPSGHMLLAVAPPMVVSAEVVGRKRLW